MPTINELFGWEKPKYIGLRDPTRNVIRSYQNANRFYDSAQEYVYIEQGMVFLSKFIHKRAHEFPKKFDAFIEMLHEHHLMGEYPATPELDWKAELTDIDDVFALLIKISDDIQEALEEFHKAAEKPGLRPMALFSEELMLQNSKERTEILALWKRWDTYAGSKTSFDSWVQKILYEEEI